MNNSFSEWGGFLVHSSKGKTWTSHKYIEKKILPNGKVRYVYSKGGTNISGDDLDTMRKIAIEDDLLTKYYNSNMPVSEFIKMVDAKAREEAGANGMPSSVATKQFDIAKENYRNPWKYWLKDK